MGDMTGGPGGGPQPAIRAARAAVFTALCVTLSAGTHVLLSGAPVPLTPLLLVSAVVFAAAYALGGRLRGYWSIAALLLPLQLAADTVFTTGQQACYGANGGPVIGPLRSMGVNLICTGGDFGTPLARLAGDAPTVPLSHPAAPWLLLGAHVAVGLGAAAWLWRGDAALTRLLRAAVMEAAELARPLLRRLTALTARTATTGAPRRRAPRTAYRRPSPALPLLVHTVVRRGPPRQAAARG
nr:hypothetical protein [Streptomyces alkaliterrae]